MMRKTGLFTVLALAAVCSFSSLSVYGQRISYGQCQSLQTQAPFNLTQFQGLWYQVEQIPNVYEFGICPTATYSLQPNGHLKVVDTQVLKDGTVDTAQGDAYIPDEKEPGKLKVNFEKGQPLADLWVVKTDYSQYTMLYSCRNVLSTIKLEFVWIASRAKTLSQDIVDSLKSEIRAMGVDVSLMIPDDQMAAACKH